MTFQE